MALHPSRGTVPHFSMRPHPLVTIAIIFVFLVGGLLAMSFFSQEAGTKVNQQRGILTLIITGILLFSLVILATSKMWFPHLWKKNSTHKRHHQHSRHHPTMRDQGPQRRR